MEARRCKWATIHIMRFNREVEAPDLDLSTWPKGAVGWKIGPDSAIGPEGLRTEVSAVWCGLGLYRERGQADAALDNPSAYLPFLREAVDSWHALLMPVAHRGKVNALDRSNPGHIFDVNADDPGGPVVMLTSAGFDPAPDANVERGKSFIKNVERIRAWMKNADGLVMQRVFNPVQSSDDGFTISIWRDDAAMLKFAYKPGVHREEADRYKTERTADRTSFTRCRAMRTVGAWEGADLIEAARILQTAS